MSQVNPAHGERATFVNRNRCISCGSLKLSRIAGGKFSHPPLASFITNDPWGVSPMPFIADSDWEYVGCDACGQAFHRYVLSSEWQDTRFSEWMTEASMREFEERRSAPSFQHMFRHAQALTAHVLRLERLTRDLRGDSAPRLLDFGCGWGQLLSIASLHGFKAYGVDRDSDRRDATAALGVQVFPNLRDLDAAACDPFHAVTLFEVLEHLDEPLGLLQTLHERMVQHGILVLETPNCEGVSGIRTQEDYRKIHPLDHINGFTPKSLLGISRRAGFEPIEPPAAYVTADLRRLAKTTVRRIAQRFRPRTTQVYLRRAN